MKKLRLFSILCLVLLASCHNESQRSVIRYTAPLLLWEHLTLNQVEDEFNSFQEEFNRYYNNQLENYKIEHDNKIAERDATARLFGLSGWDEMEASLDMISLITDGSTLRKDPFRSNIQYYKNRAESLVDEIQSIIVDSVSFISNNSDINRVAEMALSEDTHSIDYSNYFHALLGSPSKISNPSYDLKAVVASDIIKAASSNVELPVIKAMSYDRKNRIWNVSFTSLEQTVDISFSSEDGSIDYYYKINN